MNDSILSPIKEPEDRALEYDLRPGRLENYIGQRHIKETISVSINAARKRGDSLDHVLIHGYPGLGKTTLAGIIAQEMGVNFKSTSGPVIERAGDLAAILTNLSAGDVLFIDEIHRLSPVVEEILYPAMEDFQLDLVIGQGPGARSIKINLPKYTLIGATTRAGLLSAPLRDRFGISLRVDFYSDNELKEIILRSANILGINITDEGATEIAGRSRGTPRIANRLLRRVRDYYECFGGVTLNMEIAKKSLDHLDVDHEGLDRMDRYILETIIDKFNGGPVGLETISISVGDSKDTIEDVYEPFLIQKGFLARTQRGRICTEKAYNHLGKILTKRSFF